MQKESTIGITRSFKSVKWIYMKTAINMKQKS